MSGLVLTVRDGGGPPIDLTGVLPERLASGEVALAALPVVRGRGRVPLGELFALRPGGPADTLVLRPEGVRLDGVGAGMAAGSIVVEGDCGDGAGTAMRGGALRVEGGCGVYAAAEMAGGRLDIAGSAGDFLGAPLPGSPRGMRGGVVVAGRAGERVGERMRRGLIVVRGEVGGWCGARMIAGSILAGGAVADGLGTAMRRGSILLGRDPGRPPVGFVDSGDHPLLFLELMRRHLVAAGIWPEAFPATGTRARRLIGDRSAGGLGELLVL